MENTARAIKEADARTNAITILHRASSSVAHSGEPGSMAKLDSLHNAVHYLITGRIDSRRGVANLWANWTVETGL